MASVSAFLLPKTDVFSTLEVKSGLHGGVAVPLEQPVCRIGSSQLADVMLSDAAVAPDHVTLRFHARMVAIEAIGGDVEANGRPLARGTGWRTDLPVTLIIGDVTLQLSRPELSLPPAVVHAREGARSLCRSGRAAVPAVWQSVRRLALPALIASRRALTPMARAVSRRAAPLLAAVARRTAPLRRRLRLWCAPLSRVLVEQWRRVPIPQRWRERLAFGRRDTSRVLVGRNTAVTALCTTLALIGLYQLIGVDKAGANISASALHTTAMLHPQAAEAALLLTEPVVSPGEALTRRLAEAGLDGLEVRDAGSHLVVSGEFAPGRYGDWQEVQRWFDQHYGGSQLLISEARPGVALDAPAFQFQAVWFGDNPYVIDTRGERLYPGASLREGWVLAEIADDSVTVRRGSDEFSLTL